VPRPFAYNVADFSDGHKTPRLVVFTQRKVRTLDYAVEYIFFHLLLTFTMFNLLFVSNRSVTSLDQFAATLTLVEHRLTDEIFINQPVLTLSQIKRNEIYGEVLAADFTGDQGVGDY